MRTALAKNRRGSRLALIAAVVMLVPLTAGGTPTGSCRHASSTGSGGLWTSIALPQQFASWRVLNFSYAVDAFDTQRIYVADGKTVARSMDGGCTWEPVFSIAQEAAADPTMDPTTNRVIQIVVPETSFAHDRVYLLVRDSSGSDPRIRMFGSPDAGKTWSSMGASGLLGAPLRLSVASSDPASMYLLAATEASGASDSQGTILYSTANGGRSWTIASTYPHQELTVFQVGPSLESQCAGRARCTGIPFKGLVVDPQNSRELWGGDAPSADASIFRSEDGARTWKPAFVFAGADGVVETDVFHERGRPARIAVMANLYDAYAHPAMLWSADGGRSWRTRSVPFDQLMYLDSIAHGTTEQDLVVVGDPNFVTPGTFRLDGDRWRQLVPPHRRDEAVKLSSVTADRTGDDAYTFIADHVDTVHTTGYRGLIRFIPSSEPGPSIDRPCDQVTTEGDWTRIPTPIGFGVQTVVYPPVGGFAVDPWHPSRIYVTDGREMIRSADGGCTWSTAFALSAVKPGQFDFEPSSTEIASVALPSTAAPNGRVLLALRENIGSGTLPRPHVLMTDDDGAHWRSGDIGLSIAGDPFQLLSAASDTRIVYLTMAIDELTVSVEGGKAYGVAPRISLLYASKDGGATWQKRRITGGLSSDRSGRESKPGRIRSFVVDPLDANSLWAGSVVGEVWHSPDGGHSWATALSKVTHPNLDVLTIAETHTPGKLASVLAMDPTAGIVWMSDDGGKGWTPYPGGQFRTGWRYLTSAAYGANSNTALIGTFRGVYRLYLPPGSVEENRCFQTRNSTRSVTFACTSSSSGDRLWIDVSPSAAATNLVADRTAHPSFFGSSWNTGELLRYNVRADFLGRVGLSDQRFCPTCDHLTTLAHVTPAPPRVSPNNLHLTLPVGSTTSVPYVAELPRRPKVDVYLLTDSSASMSGAILAVQRGMAQMVTDLRRDGVDAWFGVGEYRTYRCDATLYDDYDFAYRRDLDVRPPDDELANTLAGLEGFGLSGAALTGLYQAATGAGQDVLPPGPSAEDVAPGQRAHWRPGALRLVVNFADRYFNTPGRAVNPGDGTEDTSCTNQTWPGPTFDQAIGALKANSIRQLGIVIGDGEPLSNANGKTIATPLGDLQRVAAGTGALAPKGGVDCDGDGRPDVPAGGPIVCRYDGSKFDNTSGTSMARAVIAAIEAAPQFGTVGVAERTHSGVVKSIAPSAFAVNLNAPNHLRFTVTYSCAVAGTFPVQLEITADSRPFGTPTAAVDCVGPAPPVAVLPLALPPPLPPPPPPLPQAPAPGPQPQGRPQQQGQPQPRVGAAPQTRQQPQTVFVRVTQEITEQQQQYAMVARRPEGPGQAGAGAVAGGAVALVAGCLALARRRVQRAWIRR